MSFLLENAPGYILTSGEFNLFCSFSVCLHRVYSLQENVESLIHHVSHARFRGFSTYASAEEFYREGKQANKVKIVREPGDDKIYGPIEKAVQ